MYPTPAALVPPVPTMYSAPAPAVPIAPFPVPSPPVPPATTTHIDPAVPLAVYPPAYAATPGVPSPVYPAVLPVAPAPVVLPVLVVVPSHLTDIVAARARIPALSVNGLAGDKQVVVVVDDEAKEDESAVPATTERNTFTFGDCHFIHVTTTWIGHLTPLCTPPQWCSGKGKPTLAEAPARGEAAPLFRRAATGEGGEEWPVYPSASSRGGEVPQQSRKEEKGNGGRRRPVSALVRGGKKKCGGGGLKNTNPLPLFCGEPCPALKHNPILVK
ncbi:WAS/WASL-interacting protein family member 3-like [Zingiber officinale]|uniref:WAS/WASL-interacting protein family member 3-like n=1 Tax=Zingiber officinale TaxID=94328 RepID=UPI001C4C0CBC|nr:WAS/WASL-interacting protein family member 3-like [Zingiber officinale]